MTINFIINLQGNHSVSVIKLLMNHSMVVYTFDTMSSRVQEYFGIHSVKTVTGEMKRQLLCVENSDIHMELVVRQSYPTLVTVCSQQKGIRLQ